MAKGKKVMQEEAVELEEEKTRKPGGGRPMGPENAARMDHIVRRVHEEPGISSPDLARELSLSTLACSQLGDRLIANGALDMVKVGNVRTYYPAGQAPE